MSLKERPVSAALKTLLVNNQPYQYAHLIKFERPSRPEALSGRISTSKQRYTYLTDASINVVFDDGSKDLTGTANGGQVYLANKVLSVGSIQEQTKATTSNTSLVLDGNALGAFVSGAATISLVSAGVWDIVYAAPISLDDLLAEGFREGDKVNVNGIPVNIDSFRAGNALRVNKVDTNLTPGTQTTELKLASEEIISVLLDKTSSEYASFINREVFIYRGYFSEGVIVGSPECVFKGIINGVSFEDSETGIKVSWSLSSHWADFAQVRGRVTSDSAHRALDSNGVPQVSSALKPIYAYDKGFIHAETSVNMLTKYVVQVEKQDVKSKKGVLGIGASVKVKKYYVPEDRFTNLDFQIQAKSIPVIYGVRKTDSIPIFADTLKTNSAEVYAASVICEGEIGGIYDIIINGNSLICNDKADSDARGQQTADNTVEVVCRGRADRGDVLGGLSGVVNSPYQFFTAAGERYSLINPELANFPGMWRMLGYSTPAPIYSFNNYGILDGESLTLTEPSSMTLDIFTGKAGQKASTQLSKIAFDKNFKIQNSYWTSSNTYEYWGPNHRLLDTAYVVGRFTISEGETTIPEISFVVRGKVTNCYNYDYSFLHDTKATTESADNFALGDDITLWRSDTNVQINSAQIIDKWTFINPDGTSNTRFRFSVTPSLNYSSEGKPGITKFYMRNAGGNTWTMVTHNYNILGAEYADAGKVFVRDSTVSQISAFSNNSTQLAMTFASNTQMTITSGTVETSPLFQMTRLVNGSYEPIPNTQTFTSALLSGTVSATSLVSNFPFAEYSAQASAILAGGATYLASKNTVRLPASASATVDFYKGYMAEITRYNSTTGKSLIQVGEITGYSGSTTQVATIDGIWDFIPTSTDTIRVYPKYADGRISINPAIQTLDYISSTTYGKGMDPYKDLDLPSWLETARKCDTRSDITVLLSTGSVVVNDVYKYTNTAGKIIWQGKVASVSGSYVTFTDIIGKLTNKWNSWKQFKEKEVVYNSSGALYVINTANVYPVEPVSGAIPVGMSAIGTFTLTRVSGTGGATVTLNTTSGNPVQGIKNGQKISGYSIYDCDDINYWKMSGWDEHAQRYATKNQCNITIDTSAPLFDNINGLLDHYNGILRYTSGKYYLDLEEQEPDILTTDIRTITVDDIVGKIQLSDEGTRSAFNSLTASFADPANKFEARNVSFFNSEYLKADRNVPKKGNLSIPGITNYYNTRALADGFLNKSRFGLTVNVTIRPSGFLLLAGTVIQIVYPRYDWGSPGKKFRIESIQYQPDGLVDIVAKEYDDSFYTASNIRRVGGTGATTVPTTSTPSSPEALTASQTQYNQIILTWTPGPDAGPGSYTEIWRSEDNDFNNATILALVPVIPGETNTYVDAVSPQVSVGPYISKFYWIRRKVIN